MKLTRMHAFLAIVAGIGLAAVIPSVVSNSRHAKQIIGNPATNSPEVRLELGSNDLSGPAKIPCYVIPEALAVTTPQGIIVFVHEYHANELARKFPSRRLTNIIIYAK